MHPPVCAKSFPHIGHLAISIFSSSTSTGCCSNIWLITKLLLSCFKAFAIALGQHLPGDVSPFVFFLLLLGVVQICD